MPFLYEYLQNMAASDGKFSWPLGMEGIWEKKNIQNDTNTNFKNRRENSSFENSYGPNGRNYMVGIPIFSQKILQSVLILTMNQNNGHTI